MGRIILREKTQAATYPAGQASEHAPVILGQRCILRLVAPLAFLLSDALVIVISALLAILLRITVFPNVLGFDAFSPVRNYLSLWPALILLLMSRAAVGLYPGYGVHPAEELKRQTVTTLALVFVVLGGSALFQFSTVYSRLVLASTAALLLFGLPLCRSMIKSVLARSRLYGEFVWVLGSSVRARELAQVLTLNPEMGLRFAGAGLEPPLDQPWIRHCLVVPEGIDHAPLADLLDDLTERFDRVWLAPNLLDIASVWVTPRDLSGHLALELRNNLLEPTSRVTKRLLDVMLCLTGLPVILPVAVVIAIWIRLADGGPIFIRQERVGKGNQTFSIVKFRTMRTDAERVLMDLLENDMEAKVEWERTRKLRNDPRVTIPGRVLRRSSLDELPQVLNVLAGQMSLVGPRPVMPDEVTSHYGKAAHLYRRVPPGITGLTQVSGRSELTYEQRVRLDTYYVRNWSVWLDFVILGRTAAAVISGRGAF